MKGTESMRVGVVFVAMLLVVFAMGFFMITQSPKKESVPVHKTFYNFIILLDLSDRIDPSKHPEQASQDLAVVKEIITSFKKVVLRRVFLKGRISFSVARQPSNYGPSDVNKMNLNLSNFPRMSPEEFEKKLEQLKTRVEELYKKAVKNDRFTGADIWFFVQDRLNKRIKRSTDPNITYRNILFILTDGYINFDLESGRPREGNRTSYMRVADFEDPALFSQFDSDDHGLIFFPCLDLRGLRVSVLEVKPKKISHYPILQKYWRKWFVEMRVSNEDILIHLACDAPVKVKEEAIEPQINKR